MGTKGITRFYVKVENEQFDLEESEEMPIDTFDAVKKIVEGALDEKVLLSYKTEDGDRIVIPYKILKKSIIKLIIV